MSLTYEISKFESNMPIRCYIHHIGNIAKHSHELLELIFVLSGECTLTEENHVYHLKADDILMLDAFTSHELSSSDCVYASLQIDQTRIEDSFPSPIHPAFSCNSQIPGKEAAFDRLRQIIAYIIKNNADKPAGFELKNWIYIYELAEVLFMNFRVEHSEALEKKNHRYAERVREISTIIKEHYTEDLTLSSLADMVHLSVPYLSKFFMEHFGVNFLTYLTNLRVKKSEFELINSEKTIETIAADCGFPNANAFTSSFKKEYGVLPSVYRRNSKAQPVATSSIEYRDYMASLKKHLTKSSVSEASSYITTQKQEASFSFNCATKPLKNNWKNVLSIGQASDLLLADVQEIIRNVKKDISFKYIFFNGIISDNNYLYQVDLKSQTNYNYIYVDRIFDFLISVGLKPILPFSYMPRDIAENPSHFLFNHLVSEPKSLDMWGDLITNFMNHIIDRYGLDEISSWKFSVWHQPNTPSRLFGFENNNDFYLLYKNTHDIVKSFSKDIAFGFPCMYYLDEENDGNYIKNMVGWCKDNDCLPDFFSYTFYDTSLDNLRNKTKDAFGFVDFMTLNPNSDGLKKAITYMHKIHRECDLEKLPVYICEWNNTPSQQDYLNDTCHKSCYITKNILENYDRVDGLAYWSLTDLMAEYAQSNELFFGCLGLFTTNKIPKASYHALSLLNKLGNNYLASQESWFATKTDKDIRIITYNYKHYSDLYAAGERFDMTKIDRYTMFEASQDLHLSININDIPDGSYQITEYILNRSHGSAFDTWVASGCIDPQTDEEIEYLKSVSIPKLQKRLIKSNTNSLSLDVTLAPLETRLIIIKL